jgi:hypothetical protein
LNRQQDLANANANNQQNYLTQNINKQQDVSNSNLNNQQGIMSQLYNNQQSLNAQGLNNQQSVAGQNLKNLLDFANQNYLTQQNVANQNDQYVTNLNNQNLQNYTSQSNQNRTDQKNSALSQEQFEKGLRQANTNQKVQGLLNLFSNAAGMDQYKTQQNQAAAGTALSTFASIIPLIAMLASDERLKSYRECSKKVVYKSPKALKALKIDLSKE